MEEAAQATGSLAPSICELTISSRPRSSPVRRWRFSTGAWTPPRDRPVALVLGRSLMEQGRLDEAEESFRAADGSSNSFHLSHRARAWIALGDLAARRGDDRQPRANTGTPPMRFRTSGSSGRR